MKKSKEKIIKEIAYKSFGSCDHDFKYSHIEYPPMGIYTDIPLNKEVVVCRRCGWIIKTNQI